MSQVTTPANVAIPPNRALAGIVALVLLATVVIALAIVFRPAAGVPATGTSTGIEAPVRDDYGLRHPALAVPLANTSRQDDYGLRHPAFVGTGSSAGRQDDYGLRHPSSR